MPLLMSKQRWATEAFSEAPAEQSLAADPTRTASWKLKRVFDRLAAAAGLLPLLPLFLIIAIAIKIDDPGPVFYRQKRCGAGKRPFAMWKFRSMRVEHGDHFQQATRHDLRVTRVGAFLRSTSLDELPQLFNVIFGEMSLVGPRPHAIAHDEQFRHLVPNYDRRYRVPPGITGLSQVSGLRGETDTTAKMARRVEMDNLYIDTWNFGADFVILLRTLKCGFIHSNAY